MPKKIGDTKVGGVKSTKGTSEVEGTEAVDSVGVIKSTSGVGGVGRAGAVGSKRRSTRTMTLEEREELFKMINEEADKMFKNSGLSAEKRALVESAVKMAVDSGLIDEDDNDDSDKKNKKGK